MTDILSGKFFLYYNQTRKDVFVVAHLIKPIGNGLIYYATIFDETATDGRELGKGLISFEDILYSNEDRIFIFDTKAELLAFVQGLAKPVKRAKPAKKAGKAK